jgi:hypothetical protein
MPPTAREIRAWAHAEGRQDIPERGPLPDTLIADYAAAHVAQNGAQAPPGAEPLQAAAPPAGEGEVPRREETAPRTVKGPGAARRAGQAAGRVRSRFSFGGKRKRRKPSRPRVPVTDMIEEAWEQLAWAAKPILPLNKILSVQAPFAGVVLEDTVRDTFIDALLQPVARTERVSRTVMGLLGPPAIIMVMLQTDQDAPQWPWLHGMLRYSLLSWAKVCDLNAAEAIERAERTSEAGAQVDMLIAWLFAMPGQEQAQQPGPQTVPGEVIRDQAADDAQRAENEARMRQVFGPGITPAGEAPGP